MAHLEGLLFAANAHGLYERKFKVTAKYNAVLKIKDLISKLRRLSILQERLWKDQAEKPFRL